MISVVVPVYNVERYLKKCIDSVLNQTFENFELILVDDGSTDNSGLICDDYAKSHPNKIRLIHQANGGLGAARNAGIDAASGEYLLFVDSDDYIEADTLQLLSEKAVKTEADLIIFDYRSVDETGKVISEHSQKLPIDKTFSLKNFPGLIFTDPLACNKLYHRSLFFKTGIRFPSRVWYEDIRTTVKIYLYAQKCIYLNRAFYNYLKRSGSIMNNASCERNSEIILALNDTIDYYKEKKLFEAYKNELEFLTIQHVYIFASVRIIRINTRHPLLKELHSFLTASFPEYNRNIYLPQLSRNHKIIFNLLEQRKYSIIRLIFKIKNYL